MAVWSSLLVSLLLMIGECLGASSAQAEPRFELSFPAQVHSEPITGRLLVILSRTNSPELRFQLDLIGTPPVFGVNVDLMQPGQVVTIDPRVVGFPLSSLKEIPAGDYYVQALLNVYTRFVRADGHVIWAHMDQWEGQQLNRSPGNLYSKVMRIHLDQRSSQPTKVRLTEVVPPVQVPKDTEWVKYIRIQSKLLTRFWGRPMFLGAVVLLPREYSARADSYYPVIYQQDHFSLEPPFGFRTDVSVETADEERMREARGMETGYQFYQSWRSPGFPRVIVVKLLHPTPYFDDSYAVDSANNGPYGTAIMTELIAYLESQFRIIRRPYARLLVGGSTGGWEALALQLFHPAFFGGAWVFNPDPVDFRRYQLIDIYKDDNAFFVEPNDLPEWERQEWKPAERSFARAEDGQSIATVRQLTRLEEVLGSRGRSTGQFAVWDAVFGPVDEDGYPKPLWDVETGKIDHAVALYMRDHGYDLRYYAETHWDQIGPKLRGKLNFYCGDMDNFYLNLGVYLFEEFLDRSGMHDVRGALEYGRPMKGHGWQPMTNAALVKAIVEQARKDAPPGEKFASAER
jgi:hypothetical protein